MVAQSALIDVRPFQLGLAVALTGLMLTLGTAHGGLVGDGFESLVALGLGTTGATILGVLLTTRRRVVPDGCEPGRDPPPHRPRAAPRTHPRPARASRRGRRPCPELTPEHALEPPVDVRKDYPDLVSDSVSGPPPVLFMQDEEAPHAFSEEHTQETLFEDAHAGCGLQAPRPGTAEAVEAWGRTDG